MSVLRSAVRSAVPAPTASIFGPCKRCPQSCLLALASRWLGSASSCKLGLLMYLRSKHATLHTHRYDDNVDGDRKLKYLVSKVETAWEQPAHWLLMLIRPIELHAAQELYRLATGKDYITRALRYKWCMPSGWPCSCFGTWYMLSMLHSVA